MRSRGLYGSYTKPGLIMTGFRPTCTDDINITTLKHSALPSGENNKVNQNVLSPRTFLAPTGTFDAAAVDIGLVLSRWRTRSRTCKNTNLQPKLSTNYKKFLTHRTLNDQNLHSVDWQWSPELVANHTAGIVCQACKT